MAQRPTLPTYDMVLAPENVAFDVQAFDSAIASHGVKLVHYRSIMCPLGLSDKWDTRSHAGHSNCTNGFIYKPAGEITTFFSQNQTLFNVGEIGVIDGSTVQITLPRFYDDEEGEKEVLVQRFDRFFLKDTPTNTVTTQRFEAHQTGIDRMQYSVTDVEYIIDATGAEYAKDSDFVIDNGAIRWVGKRPGFDPKTGKGTICSIRYRYCPFWYVSKLLHEVRVSRDYNPYTGESQLVRMPYAVLLQREYVFEKAQREAEENSNDRAEPSARDGGFGPR